MDDECYGLIVIGAGWSGLLACKYALEENISVLVIEKREDVGGVWNFSEDASTVTVMQNTGTSSSATVTEMSDFPMPPEIGDFPKHNDILAYIRSYAEQYELRSHIRFGCGVTSAMKQNEKWIVETDSETKYRSNNLMVCTGVHQRANRALQKGILKDFTGEIHHAGTLKRFDESHKGKRIMIIGGGETASDVMDEWYPHVTNMVWCIPRGQHFFRKYSKLFPHRAPQALDKASSRALKLISPHVKSKPGLAWVCRWTTNGSLIAYQGHGIPEFKNDADFFHSFINKHAHALDYVDYEKVIPKSKIEHVSGKRVYFCDGSEHEVDVIIQCTGYDVEFPFLPDQYKCEFSDLYKFVYDVNDTTLSYVGYVRPIVGSIPGIAEMSARWVTRAISGRVQLADFEERTRAVEADKRFWMEFFENTSRRIGTLVEGYTYLDSIAQLSACYPNYWALFKESPKDFFVAYFAPYNGCSYRLNEREHRAKAIDTLRSHSKGTITPLNLFAILFLRLIMFDWFCDLLGEAKYKLQTSRMWKYVRDWRIVCLLNYFWCMPKRLIFDNVTR